MISELGLTNQHVEAQQAFFGKGVSERHRGIPYPGTFILDEGGTVVGKEFEQSYRDRASGSYLLDQLGVAPLDPGAQEQEATPGVKARAWVGTSTYRPLQKVPVHVRLDMADGVHVYVPPVPDGFVPLSVVVPGHEALLGGSARVPNGTPHAVEGLGERFFVVTDQVDLTVPVKLAGRGFELDGQQRAEPRPEGAATIPVVIRYQACTSTECFPPQELQLELGLTEEDVLRPER
ncbi:MAG: hypothetical protein GEU93_06425 [Propionibacteriales bacterium]|nr:hypothetical protein [Propionibacteriales bacterium]